ncbi:MAG: hypothetical protein ACRCVV_07105, partial [Shewanella sp.]
MCDDTKALIRIWLNGFKVGINLANWMIKFNISHSEGQYRGRNLWAVACLKGKNQESFWLLADAEGGLAHRADW